MPRNLYRYLGLALILLLAACTPAGGGGGGSKPTINSFTATNVASGGGNTTLSWNVTAATSLSIDQGVGSVIPVTSGSTTKAITATTTFTLTATNANGSVTATATATVSGPTTITVSGKVIDFYGQGAAGLAVKIGSTTATTASDGTFSISGVTTPYDATLINSTSKLVVVYKGLTRPDPNLVAINLGLLLVPPKTATFSGNLSGGAGFPSPPNHTTRVFFGSPETLVSVSSPAGPAYGPMGAAWFGPDSTAGNVYALQWQFDPGTNLPVDYKGYGQKAQTLSNGGIFSNQDVTLGSLAEDTISGNVTVPTGYTLSTRRANLRVAPGSGVTLFGDPSTASNYSYTTPRITGATISLLALANNGTRQSWGWKAGVATNASGVNIDVAAAPSLTIPVNNATGVTINTDFQTTGFSGGVNLFYFNGPGTNPDFYVITTGTTTKIPDLSSVGLGLPTTGVVAYTWAVLGVQPFASTDAAAGAGGFLKDYVKVVLSSGAGPDSDGGFGTSETFNFTTP